VESGKEWELKKKEVKGFAGMFKAERVFDRSKLDNDVDYEFEDIVWKMRWVLAFLTIVIHIAPAVHLFVVKGTSRLSALEVFLNAFFPFLVPLAVVGGYKMPYLLAVCDNNMLWNNIEYKIACSWCNAFVFISMLMLISVLAVNVYPLLFVCAAYDMMILWIVSYRICAAGSNKRQKDRFSQNSKRAASRKKGAESFAAHIDSRDAKRGAKVRPS